MTLSVAWPFDSQVAISYRFSIVIKSLSPAVSEILGTKHIGAKTLTFHGHVTSGLARVNFLLVILRPKSLYLTVSGIFRPKRHVVIDTMLNRYCAYTISCDVYPLCKITYLNFSPLLCLFTMSSSWPQTKNKGCSLSGPLMLKAKSSENFRSPKFPKFWLFIGALEIRGYEKLSCDFYCKRHIPHILAWIHVVRAILRQHRLEVWPLAVSRKKVRKSRTPIGMMCRR